METKRVQHLPTSKEVFKRGAEFILTNLVEYLEPRSKAELEMYLAPSERTPSYFHASFQVGKYTSFRIDIDFSFSGDAVRDTDSKDTYTVHKDGPRVRVGFPSYGSMPASEAFALMAVWENIAQKAALLELEFKKPTAELYETFEQEETRKVAQEAKRVQTLVERFVGNNAKHLRVNVERLGYTTENVPDGTYHASLNDKTYEITFHKYPDVGTRGHIIRLT